MVCGRIHVAQIDSNAIVDIRSSSPGHMAAAAHGEPAFMVLFACSDESRNNF